MIRKKTELQLHFVGIGGIGMSGIAEVFLNQGYKVSGSDISDSDTSRRLRDLGAKIQLGHSAENVQGADVVVISSAIRPSNPEVQEARRLRIPIIPRAEMLGELMRGKTGVAVAGTHGKTTTTSMLATILTFAGMDPTLVIGGKVDSLGGNAKLGQGQFVVAEADESDGSFLHLPATYGVITNIDNDHLDHFGSLSSIEDAFSEFVSKLPFYGVAAVCVDDPGVKRCLTRFSKPVLTYGFSEEAEVRATQLQVQGMGSSFHVVSRGKDIGKFELTVPGSHNVSNALAAIALSEELGIKPDVIQQALKGFKGVKRRFEVRYENAALRQVVVDDYGHHPTEVAATLAAARGYWPDRIIAVFQPHRFSRTLHCHDGFLSAFQKADILLMTDVYSAGEDPIEGVTAETLLKDIRRVALPQQELHYVGDLEGAKNAVLSFMREGDLVVCMGAGTITRLPDQIKEQLEKRGG